MNTTRSQSSTPAQQLAKVKQVGNLMQGFLGLALGFYGIGLVLSLIRLVAASSFQLSLADGDLGLTYFSREVPEAIITLYDNKLRVSLNVEGVAPAVSDMVRVATVPTLALRVVAGLLLVLNSGVVMALLQQLSQLFHLYARSEIFTHAVVTRIRYVGFALMGLPIVTLLNSLIGMALSASLGGEPTAAYVAMSPLLILAAVVVLMISWIMDVGRSLQDEQDLTI